MLGQGVQTVRPYCRVDHPIAQAFGVVAAQMEPAVVEYEAFHADFGGAVGELVQCGFVVVEVHGFHVLKVNGWGLVTGFTRPGVPRSQVWKREAMPSRPSAE